MFHPCIKQVAIVFALTVVGALCAHGQTIASSGLPMPVYTCDKFVAVTASAGANMTKLVTLSSSRPTIICSLFFVTSASGNVQLKYGTNTTNPCDTGTVAITGNMPTVTSTNISIGTGNGLTVKVPTGFDVCVLATTGNITGFLTYAQ